MIERILCFLGIHKFKWGEPYEENYETRFRTIGGVSIQLDKPYEFSKIVQDGTCEYSGKIKRNYLVD